MDFLTNPWFIAITIINILALIYLAIKFYYNPKNEPLLFERLRDADVHITIRTPPKPSDLKGGDTDCNQNNKSLRTIYLKGFLRNPMAFVGITKSHLIIHTLKVLKKYHVVGLNIVCFNS